jgi:hypothetical protein
MMIASLPSITLGQETTQPFEDPVIPAISYTDEIRFPLLLQAPDKFTSGLGGGVEYNRYPSSRIHDARHLSRFSEAVGRQSSSIHFSLFYGPNFDLGVTNKGYSVGAGAAKLFGDIGLGVSGRYSRVEIEGSEREVDDFEIGPQIELWPSSRLYLHDRILFRRIDGYRDPDIPFAFSDEAFLQLRHHLTYIAGENWTFTYAHDVSLSIGTDQDFHTNNVSMDNYFLLSPSSRFSYGPVAGFRLKYIVGSRTSVLTLPVRARGEYFLEGIGMLYGELGYDIPTMQGQQDGQVLFVGSFSYRF